MNQSIQKEFKRSRRARINRFAKKLYLASLFLALLLPVSVQAEPSPPKLELRLPAGSLRDSLMTLAKNNGLELVYETELAAGVQADALQGQYTLPQALQKLLLKTDLNYRIESGKTIILSRNRQGVTSEKLLAMHPMEDYMYAAAEPEEESYDGPVEQMDMTVQGMEVGYSVLNASTATKTDTLIMETPVSVQVIPRTVIEDQKISRIKDALENVSGVQSQSTLGMGTGFIVRGFRTVETYRNGLIASAGASPLQSEFDTSNIESIEVLKGPASILYGRVEPGGLINVTTKKPLATSYYSLDQQVGSYDFYRTQWDATGPLTEDGSLLYRLTGSYQDNNSFRDFITSERINAAAAITWKLTDSTDFNLNVEGMNQDFQADLGILPMGDGPAPIPISRTYSSDPNDPLDNQSKVYIGTEINHRFNDDWAIHHRFLAKLEHADQIYINPAPSFRNAFQADGHTLNRNIFFQTTEHETYHTNLDFTGHFSLGFSDHKTLVGFDYFQGTSEYAIFGNFLTPNPELAFDLFNPSYGIRPELFQQAYNTTNFPGANLRITEAEWYGAYFQDHITLWDKLHILGGGRYDWAKTGNVAADSNNPSAADPIDFRHDEAFSPRVGILYQPIEELAVYGNWTTSFGVNNGVSATGASFDPQIGEQFEAGFKTQLFDNRLTTTVAYYYITKTNILTADLSTPDPNDRIAIGEQRSQGIELDVTGQINDNFSLIGSYAYTDGRVTKSNDALLGQRLSNVPEHLGSLWLKYDFKGIEAVDGLSLGLGGVAVGQRDAVYPAATYNLPGYVRMDAYASYKWKINTTKVTAQFNIRNILDKNYYESTDIGNVGPNGIYPGAPLTAIGSIKVEF